MTFLNKNCSVTVVENQEVKRRGFKLAAPKSNFKLLAFFVPTLIILMAFFFQGVYPFGDRHILTVDLFHQYAPFLLELRDKILSGDSLFYSFNGGMGFNFFSVLCYYSFSPLNLLLVILPKVMITEAVLMFTCIKIGLSGLFMFLLLRHFKVNELNALAFATAYALSGYALAYSWNIMWLDTLYCLPLCVLALCKLLIDHRYIGYILILALTVMINFYTGFFVCIFLGLYIIPLHLRLADQTQGLKLKNSILKFLVASAVAMGVAMVVLLPVFYYLRLTSAASDTFPDQMSFRYAWLDFLSRFLPNHLPASRDGMPNIYAGLPIVLLLPLYLLNRRLSFATRMSHLAVSGFILLSFNLNYLDFLWHGMHFPNQLPFRFAFVLPFIMVIMAADGRPNSRMVKDNVFKLSIVCLLLTILFLQKVDADKVSAFTVILTVVLSVFYILLLKIENNSPFDFKFSQKMFALLLIVELTFNSVYAISMVNQNEYYGERSTYLADYVDSDIRDFKLQYLSNEQGQRMEFIPDRTVNTPLLFTYPGLTIFSSTYPTKPVKFFSYLGLPSNGINSYQYCGSNIVVDSLLGINYLARMGENYDIDDRQRTVVSEQDGIKFWQNDHALNLMYWVPSASDTLLLDNPQLYVDNQNAFAKSLGASEDVLNLVRAPQLESSQHVNLSSITEREYSVGGMGQAEANSVFNTDIESEGDYYVNYTLIGIKRRGIRVEIGDKTINVPDRDHGMLELGHLQAGSKVKFITEYSDDFSENGTFKLEVLKLNEPVFNNLISNLKQGEAQVNMLNSANLQATVDVRQDGYVLFTTTADPGWKISVDGRPVETKKFSDAMILIPVTSGEHQITARFTPQGLRIGSLISIITLFLLIVFSITQRRGWLKFSERVNDEETVI